MKSTGLLWSLVFREQQLKLIRSHKVRVKSWLHHQDTQFRHVHGLARLNTRITDTLMYPEGRWPSRVLSMGTRYSGDKRVSRFLTGDGSFSMDEEADINEYKRYINGEFGTYKLVVPGKVTPRRLTPAQIQKPEYWKTGKPKMTYVRQPEALKSESHVQKLREACKLARFVLDSVLGMAKAGVTTEELDVFAHNLIIEHSAYPSPLNYRGFPKSICTSVNNVTCHGIPDDRCLEDGDIVNIDVTVYINGFHGDCSETICIGHVDSIGRELVHATKECLNEGIGVCGPEVPFQNIGRAIQSLALGKGYSVVPAFTGHGIGQYFHCPPDIYHIDYDYRGSMVPGMAFTIEPVLSQGSEMIDILDDGWTAVSIDGSRSAQFEHTVYITNSGVEVLTQ